MSSFIEVHAELQRLLVETNLSTSKLSSSIRDVLALALQPELTFEQCLHDLQQRKTETKGSQPELSLALLLIAWAGYRAPLATRYMQQLMLHTFMRLRQTESPPDAQPSQLVYCAQFIAKHRFIGTQLRTILAHLITKPELAEGREILSDVLLHQADGNNALAVKQRFRPLPRRFLQAIRDWPEQESLLKKVLTVLDKHPRLQYQLRQQATLRTQQRHLLPTKQALLFLGPAKSREFILLTHFQQHLTAPVFPLRATLLQRRAMLAFSLQAFCSLANIRLPISAELISYFLVYDLWFDRRFTTQVTWHAPASKAVPDAINAWLPWQKSYDHRHALKLLDYWQMPSEVAALLTQHDIYNTAQACIRLSHCASILICDYGGAIPKAWHSQLEHLISILGIKPRDFRMALVQLAERHHIFSPYQKIPL